MRNIELKARLGDLPAARVIAERLATRHVGRERQVDTYFHCPTGRLKLRELERGEAQLVAYQRADASGPKGSDYTLVAIADAPAMKTALASTLGVRAVVDKQREVFLIDNVRVHLDEVAGLGEFIEFEAVLSDTINDAAGHAQVTRLMQEFGLADADLVAASYGELIGAKQ